jgi:uncharacterized protein with GYD domain
VDTTARRRDSDRVRGDVDHGVAGPARRRLTMPKYLWQVSYSQAGLKGLLKEGGSSRVAAIKKLAESRGGKVEAFYFAFGEDDVYLIADLPSQVDAAAISLAVGASGAARVRTIVLLTPEEIDAATKVDVGYRPPGA